MVFLAAITFCNGGAMLGTKMETLLAVAEHMVYGADGVGSV